MRPGFRQIPLRCVPQRVHLSSGGLHPIPNRSISSSSLSCHVSPPCSKSITLPPVVRSRTPLYRRKSRWKVVSPDHPSTAHPIVCQGEIIISTRRWGFGFFLRLPPSCKFIASESSNSGSCQTTNALSSESKCFPVSSPRYGVVCCSRCDDVMCSANVCVT